MRGFPKVPILLCLSIFLGACDEGTQAPVPEFSSFSTVKGGTALAQDSGGRLFVAGQGEGSIGVYEMDGSYSRRFETGVPLVDLVIDGTGYLWLLTSKQDGTSLGAVVRLNPAGSELQRVYLPAVPAAMVLSADASAWVVAGSSLFHIEGERALPVMDVAGDARDMVMDSKGYLWILSQGATAAEGPQLAKASTGGLEVVRVSVALGARSLAVGPEDNIYVLSPGKRVSAYSSGAVLGPEFNLPDSEVNTLSRGLAVDQEGNVLTVYGTTLFVLDAELELVSSFEFEADLEGDWSVRDTLVDFDGSAWFVTSVPLEPSTTDSGNTTLMRVSFVATGPEYFSDTTMQWPY